MVIEGKPNEFFVMDASGFSLPSSGNSYDFNVVLRRASLKMNILPKIKHFLKMVSGQRLSNFQQLIMYFSILCLSDLGNYLYEKC